MEPVIQIKNLRTSFMTSNGEVQAVRGVSFSVNPGEILGVVGESGSGKSVTSMSILRLLADTAVIKENSTGIAARKKSGRRCWSCSARCGFRSRRSGMAVIRMSFPAVCANAS